MNSKRYSNSLAAWCWLLLSATIIVIVAFCHFPDAADWKWCLPLEGRYHIPMMVGGFAFVAIASLFVFKCCRSETLHRGRLWAITAALTCIQTLLVYSYYVHTDWDVQQVTGLAQAMAEGRSIEEFESYFRWSPNNLLLSRLFALVFFVTGPLWGLKTTLFPLLMLQCAGAGLTALMLVQTAMHIWHRKDCAVMVYVLYTLLVWLSPWWSVPYSDIWGLMLSVLLLWMATAAPFKRQWVRIFVFAAVSALGYYIKPQTLFVGFAIVLVQLLDMLRNRDSVKKLLRPTGTALGGIAAGVLLAHIAVAGCGLHLHTSKGLDAPHYLMMGANYQSIGIYSAQDVDFSRSYPKKKERHRAEMEETMKRYKAHWPRWHPAVVGPQELAEFQRRNILLGPRILQICSRADRLAVATDTQCLLQPRGKRALERCLDHLCHITLVWNSDIRYARRPAKEAGNGKRRADNGHHILGAADADAVPHAVRSACALSVLLRAYFHTGRCRRNQTNYTFTKQ